MIEDFQLLNLKNFTLEQVRVFSKALKGNPLGDPTDRTSPIMLPKKYKGPLLPLVYVLAGFTGNGPKYLGPRSFEPNMAEQIDQQVSKSKAPKAIYVFVDAFSFWGGSQFINSEAVGNYEDYIVTELHEEILDNYPVDEKKVLITGLSSGGYGALHLASKYPSKFPYCAALAPDSFFEASFLGDMYKSAEFLSNHTYAGLKKLHSSGKILSRRDGHILLNAIGMTACYSTTSKSKLSWPIDLKTGELNKNAWKNFKKHDPLVFLEKRASKLKKLKKVYLEVGTRDQFHLQMGARQMKAILKKQGVSHHYNEFSGTHFDFAERRPHLWDWLNRYF